jgi:hypothetical protein
LKWISVDFPLKHGIIITVVVAVVVVTQTSFGSQKFHVALYAAHAALQTIK